MPPRPAPGNTPAGLAKKTGHRDMEDVILEAADVRVVQKDKNLTMDKTWL